MTVSRLIDNIIAKKLLFTVDDVWREVIAYVVVSGSKVDIKKQDIKNYLDSIIDLVEENGTYRSI